MKFIYFLAFILLVSCQSPSTELSTSAISAIKTSITDVMNTQALDWSKGDIDAFMEGYWKDEKLRFVGSRGITYGWDQTKANYKKGYPDKAAMG